MKVAVTPKSARRSAALTWSGVLKAALLLLVLLAVVATAFVVVRPDFTQRAAARLEARWGYMFSSVDAGLTDQWSIVLGVYLREALDGIPVIPQLTIDVPFKEISKIYAKRDEALARGILVQGPDDFVNGEVRFEDRSVPVKLRLKGDWNDHLAGRKWSFRIHTRRGEQLFGMRRFSIQNPDTRGFQSEIMYFDVLRNYGVMSPRYQFINVMLNGEPMGLMALEEFFSKEMLEFNRRREGVIVRFDESYAWASKDAITGEAVGWGGAFDDYRNARVDAFGSTKIAESATLTKQYRVAEGLLNGFADGKLNASDVFDVDQLGAFLAVSDMFGSWHAIAWHNLRFYLNPVTLRLEPIAFDATLQDRFDGPDSVISDEPIALAMLNDPQVLQRYASVMRDLRDRAADGALDMQLQDIEAQHLPLLQTEFRMLSSFPADYLGARVEALLSKAAAVKADEVLSAYAFYDERERDQYAVLAHFGYDSEFNSLAVETAVPREVELRAVNWVAINSAERVSALLPEQLPVALPARGIGAEPALLSLPLLPVPDINRSWRLDVEAGFPGRNWSREFAAVPAAHVLTQMPLPSVSEFEALPFIESRDGSILFREGDWEVAASIVTPRGLPVVIPAGTRLRFAPDALLVINGPLQIKGTATAPVSFAPASDSWPGIVVMAAAEPSVVQYAEFRSTHGVTTENWTLTGGVNFYASDVTISDTLFAESSGEDALNIINSTYTLNNITVNGTASDGFDGDFSDGTVNGGSFIDIGRAGGGDAIDVSGSNIDVQGTQFRGVADKALSVGERSTMRATAVSMQNVGTGAAAKDGSLLEISDAQIDGASFAALTAYIKKPEYGPAEVRAQGVRISGAETTALVQMGSRIVVDGAAVEAQDVDVDALYDTVMKPGLR